MVNVKCLDVDQRGRIKLSIKEANPKAAEEAPAEAHVEAAPAAEPKTED
jgi:polyribonucleotide nucleotidyltransferase